MKVLVNPVLCGHRHKRAGIFLIGKYKMGDEKGMIECIRSEYGDTYFRQDFYSARYIRDEAKKGHMNFFVIRTMRGEIAGMAVLKESAQEKGMCEIASLIIKKEYRGYGIAKQMFAHELKQAGKAGYDAVLSLPVLYHDMSQRLLGRQGFCATGFLLNVFDVEQIVHSYDNGRNKKHSQGILVMAQKKKNAGRLYLPPEHEKFCTGIFDRLGVSYLVEKAEYEKIPTDYTEFSCSNDERQHSLEIRINKVGANVQAVICQIHKQYPLTGKQTANVLLNINDENVMNAYRILEREGYFFTGLKPLCGRFEYLIMHNPGSVEFYPEDYVLSQEFRSLLSYCAEMRSR